MIPNKSIALIALLFGATCTYAEEANLCTELSPHILSDDRSDFTNPSRAPTEAERALIEKSKIDLLEGSVNNWTGTSIVDADNDGHEDVFVWANAGTGRFVYGELFDIRPSQGEDSSELIPSGSMDLGVLNEPRFVRYKDVNYLVSADDDAGDVVSRISRTGGGRDEKQTLCLTQTTIELDTYCRHPACKELREVIKKETKNGPFVKIEWPHKYFEPAGLEVYYAADWSKGDFDNAGKPTSIWRIGREEYLYQNIYWALLGQGDEMPKVDPKLRPRSEDRKERHVLPGPEHDRLRRTLTQQSEALSKQLNRPVSLLNEGEFFLFKASGNRTYWAWDLGMPPIGEEIYVMYTNARKSDYVGSLHVTRNVALVPCTSGCVTP
jgi:hypothetical protein